MVTAAKLAGLSREAVDEWYARGEHDEPNGAFALFRQSIDAAEAEAEAESLRGVRAAGEKDWRAHAAFLGRRHRARWSEQPVAGGNSASGLTINIGLALPGAVSSGQVIDAQVVSVPLLEDE